MMELRFKSNKKMEKMEMRETSLFRKKLKPNNT